MNPVIQALGRRLRLGVVGGSSGFIGPVHRTAARLDDLFEIAAGVLSSDPQRGAAVAALDAGLDVVCDKPLTTSLADALDLVRRVRDTRLVFCTTYNYSAYPM